MSLLGKEWYTEYIDYKDGYKAGYAAAMKESTERKTGKWEIWQDCEGKSRTYTCPICGHVRRSWSAPNYCENCGAKMEVDE